MKRTYKKTLVILMSVIMLTGVSAVYTMGEEPNGADTVDMVINEQPDQTEWQEEIPQEPVQEETYRDYEIQSQQGGEEIIQEQPQQDDIPAQNEEAAAPEQVQQENILGQNEETAAPEQAQQNDIPAQSEGIAAPEQTQQENMPAQNEETAAPEQPQQDDVPAQNEETAAQEQPQQDDVPAQNQETCAQEQPQQDDVPAQNEETAAQEQPQQDNVPVQSGETVVPEPQENTPAQTTMKLEFMPLTAKIRLQEEQLTAGTYYSELIEIRNISNQVMKDIRITLRSKESTLDITYYKDITEVQPGAEKDWKNIQNENKDIHFDERELMIRELAPGAEIKAEIVLLANWDLIPDRKGIEAQISCVFTAQDKTFSSEGEWKIYAERSGNPQTAPDTREAEQPQESEAVQEEQQPQEPEEIQEAEQSQEPEEVQEEQKSQEPEEIQEAEQPQEPEEVQEEQQFQEPAEIVEEQLPAAETADEGWELQLSEYTEPAVYTELSGYEETEQYMEPEEDPEPSEQMIMPICAVWTDTDPRSAAATEPGGEIPPQIQEQTKEEQQMEEEIVSFQVIEDPEEETETETEDYYEDYYYDDGSYYYDDWGYYDGVSGTEQINTATPYLLVKSYSHKRTVRTGEPFGVEVTLLNTSQKLGMENIIIKVETSEALSLANGTNTLFVSSIEAGGTTSQTINLLAASECKDPAQKLNLSITYDYIENKERKQGTGTESITIPISQQDRLELRDPVYDEMEAGREGVISISYINKGFSSLYNMEASIKLENADALQSVVYAGNVESGKSGTLDFVVTPMDEGDYYGEVTLKYEDSSQKEVAVAIPLQFTSTMAYVADDLYYDEEYYMMEETQEPASFPTGLVAAIGIAAAVVVILTTVLIRKKRKAKAVQKDNDILEDWFAAT